MLGLTKEEKEGTKYHQETDHDGDLPISHVDHVPLLGGRVLVLLYLYNLL